MPGQLRYELIGDASEFVDASGKVVNAAEVVDDSLTELQQQLRTAARDQVAYNETAEQYVDAAGNFISAAEGQSRVLQELNAIGIKTEEQYEAQIKNLQRLADAVEEGSLAHNQLMERQEQLQREMIQTGEASERVAGNFGAAMGPANDLGFLLQDLQTFSIDATMGMRSISNNIPGVLMGMQRMKSAGQGLTTMFTGAGGFILAVNAAAAALPILVDWLRNTEEQAKESVMELSRFEQQVRSAVEVDLEGPGLGVSFEDVPVSRLEQATLESARTLAHLREQRSTLREVAERHRRINVLQRQEETLQNVIRNAAEDRAATQRQNLLNVQSELETQQALLQDAQSILNTEAESSSEALRRAAALQRQLAVEEQIVSQLGQQLQEAGASADAVARLKELLGDAFVSAENTKGESEEITTALDDAREMAEELAQKWETVTGETGRTLANIRLQNEGMQALIDFQIRLNRLRAQGRDEMAEALRDPSMAPVAPLAPAGAPGSEEGRRRQALQAAREAGFIQTPGELTLDEILQSQEAGQKIDDNVNRQLEQSIQLASQLGATLINAAQEGGATFRQVFGSILQTVGSILGFAHPGLGAAIAGTGTLVQATESPETSTSATTASAASRQVRAAQRSREANVTVENNIAGRLTSNLDRLRVDLRNNAAFKGA